MLLLTALMPITAVMIQLPHAGHALLIPSSPSLQCHSLSPPSSLPPPSPLSVSFSIQTSRHKNVRPFSTDVRDGLCQRIHPYRFSYRGRDEATLYASKSASNINVDSSNKAEQPPLSLAMAVGIIASLIGFLYSKMMKIGFKFLWKTLPSKLFEDKNSLVFSLLNQHPSAYIVLMTTLGGLAVGVLSTLCFPNLFSAHDFVHILSRDKDVDDERNNKMDGFPKARHSLLPVMGLSLLTSITGFSLGPEAPMVRFYSNFDFLFELFVRFCLLRDLLLFRT